MSRPEELIWQLDSSCTQESDWRTCLDVMVERLETSLNGNATNKRYSVNPGNYASCWTLIQIKNTPVPLSLETMVMLKIADETLWTYAEMLVFSNGQRIGLAKNSGHSILTAKFEKDNDSGSWSTPVWEFDESGEWEGHLEL